MHGGPGAGPVAELVADVHLHPEDVWKEPEERAITEQDLSPVQEVGGSRCVTDGVGGHAVEPKGVRVVDGRQVEGVLGDEMGQGFFLLPIDARTNTARVYVLSHAVRSVV